MKKQKYTYKQIRKKVLNAVKKREISMKGDNFFIEGNEVMSRMLINIVSKDFEIHDICSDNAYKFFNAEEALDFYRALDISYEQKLKFMKRDFAHDEWGECIKYTPDYEGYYWGDICLVFGFSDKMIDEITNIIFNSNFNKF